MTMRPLMGLGVVSLILAAASCCDECNFPLESNGAAPEVDVFTEPGLNRLFTRSGGGWTGGEGAASVPLPDGRIAWLFGHTYVDTVYTDRSRPMNARQIDNSIVIQDGASVVTLYSGSPEAPRPFADTGVEGFIYYPLNGIVRQDALEILYAMYKTEGESVFDRQLVAIDVLAYELEHFGHVRSARILSNPSILFGSAVLEDEDYIYIFGTDTRTQYAHVARVGTESLIGFWEYYTSSGWDPSVKESAGLVRNASDQFSVFRQGSNYYLLKQAGDFGKEIRLLSAARPTGPWVSVKVLYHTLETQGRIVTYSAMAHRHLGLEHLIVSYTVASLDMADAIRDAETFRPFFVRVENWE